MFANTVIWAVVVLVLASCAEPKEKKGAKPPPPTVTFQPGEKPSKPVSGALLQQVLKNLKSASSFIPEDAAYFGTIIVGSTLQEINEGSADQQQALAKLAPEGRAFLSSLLGNCVLSPAKKSERGQAQPGGTLRTILNLASDGKDCGYFLKKSVLKTRSFSPTSIDPKTRATLWTENVSMQVEDLREVRDLNIRILSQVTGLHFVNNITGTLDYQSTSTGVEVTGLLKGAGRAKISFANTLTLEGPLDSETVITAGDKIIVKVRFLASTGQGDILFLAIRDELNVLKVYVNGELVQPEVLDAFGLNLLEVASRRE